MSIQITYKRLFQIALRHDYFQDGHSRSICLKPSLKSMNLMQSGRILSKQLGKSIIASFRTNHTATDPLIDLGLDVEFEFTIEISELPTFTKRTKLDTPAKKFTSGAFLLFKNVPANASTQSNNPEMITHQVLDGVRPALFTYEFTPVAPPLTLNLIVTNESGTPVSAGLDSIGNPLPTTLSIVPDGGGVFEQSVDLRSLKPQVYTFTWKDGPVTILAEQYFISDEYAIKRNTIGILRLTYTSGTAHLYNDTEHYAVQFARKKTRWKYYVMNKNGAVDMVGNTLLITNPDGITPPYPNVSFAASGTIPHPSIAIGNLQTAVFEADQEMPLFENPKLNLQLIEQNGGVDRILLEHLPNPSVYTSIKNTGVNEISEMYVFV